MNKKQNFKTKKRRYKLLCKKLIDLKKIIQNKAKIVNFKKKKWKSFIESLRKKDSQAKKQIFRLYDQNCHYVSKFQTKFKWNYKKRLQSQRVFSFYYGYLLRNYIKIQLKIAKRKRKILKEKLLILSKIFLDLFERRLDTIIYRSHFVNSIRTAKQLILHRHVKVNGKIVDISSYKVNRGDVIDFIKKKEILINMNNVFSYTQNAWPVPAKHLQVNYRTYQIIIIENLNFEPLTTIFPFYLDLNSVLKHND